MFEPFQKAGEQFQKIGKDNFDAAVRSYGELNKGLQAISAKLVDYPKTWFEQTTKALEQLVGAKSLEQAFEIQSQYAKKACDLHVAETSKLSEMYVALLRGTYNPIEQVASKKAANLKDLRLRPRVFSQPRPNAARHTGMRGCSRPG